MATTITTVPAVHSQVVHVPAVARPVAPVDHPAKKFKNVFMGVGIGLVILGVISIILGGVSYSWSVARYRYYVGSGIWGGAWYIASGGLAIATGSRANSCNVIGGMVVSILTSLVAFGVGIGEAIAAGLCDPYRAYDRYYDSYFCTHAFQGVHGTIACVAFFACVLAIIHSSYCCCGTCGGSSYQGGIVTTTVTTVPAGQVPLQPTYVAAQPYTQQVYYPPMQPQQVALPAQPQAAQAFMASPSAGYGAPPMQTQPAYAPPPYPIQKQVAY